MPNEILNESIQYSHIQKIKEVEKQPCFCFSFSISQNVTHCWGRTTTNTSLL